MASCMVMSCISNRVRLGWGSWLDVLDRVPTVAAENTAPTGTPDVWEPVFHRLLQEVEGIFDGSKDYTQGALYWADLRCIETEFFKTKILGQPDQHPRIADMNSLVFFK